MARLRNVGHTWLEMQVTIHVLCTGMCKDGSLRLIGTDARSDDSHIFEGRLEVCLFGGVWGTVCDDDWDDRDATVACTQLANQYGMRFTGKQGRIKGGAGGAPDLKRKYFPPVQSAKLHFTK
jgi:hypothetical protein